jgi:hypothetical protein
MLPGKRLLRLEGEKKREHAVEATPSRLDLGRLG